jgi:hypothetical protein
MEHAIGWFKIVPYSSSDFSLYESIFLSVPIRHVSVIHTLFLRVSIFFFLYLVPQNGRSISM